MNEEENSITCSKCGNKMEIINNSDIDPFEVLVSGTGSTNLSITRDPANEYPSTEEDIKINRYRCPKCGYEDQGLV
jgi:DNA-directed RNA polymerase subunit RPC12/RpoP